MSADKHPAVRDKYGYVWRWETLKGRTGYRWYNPDGLDGNAPASAGVGWQDGELLAKAFGPLTEVPE